MLSPTLRLNEEQQCQLRMNLDKLRKDNLRIESACLVRMLIESVLAYPPRALSTDILQLYQNCREIGLCGIPILPKSHAKIQLPPSRRLQCGDLGFLGKHMVWHSAPQIVGICIDDKWVAESSPKSPIKLYPMAKYPERTGYAFLGWRRIVMPFLPASTA